MKLWHWYKCDALSSDLLECVLSNFMAVDGQLSRLDERNKPLRVGVAGLRFGGSVHVPVFKGIKDVEVIGIAGSNEESSKKAGAMLGVNFYSGYEEMLKSNSLDAVSLAMPPYEMSRASELALERGLPILAEKPIAPTAKIATELAEKSRNMITCVDFQFAELKTFRELKIRQDEKNLGELHEVDFIWKVLSYAHENKKWSWKTDAKRGGGVLTILGSHAIYLIEWLIGPIKAVIANLDNTATKRFAPDEGISAPDKAEICFELVCGMKVRGTIDNSSNGEFIHKWQFQYENGELVAVNRSRDYMSGFYLERKERNAKDAIIAKDYSPGIDGRIPPFARLARRYVEAVSHNEPMQPNFSDGARVQKIVDAIVSSSELNRKIEISSIY